MYGSAASCNPCRLLLLPMHRRTCTVAPPRTWRRRSVFRLWRSSWAAAAERTPLGTRCRTSCGYTRRRKWPRWRLFGIRWFAMEQFASGCSVLFLLMGPITKLVSGGDGDDADDADGRAGSGRGAGWGRVRPGRAGGQAFWFGFRCVGLRGLWRARFEVRTESLPSGNLT